MMSLDAAFDRIGSALRQMGYAFAKEEKPADAAGDRVALFTRPNFSVRVRWYGSARMLALQVDTNGEWVDFAKRSFGPSGLEETAVEALVRAVRNEVAETSTDSD
jgi:hypothetical protein